jgi:hypothetical protein
LSELKISEPFDGWIDEVAFFGEALTVEQIGQLMTGVTLGITVRKDPSGFSGTIADYLFAYHAGGLVVEDTRLLSVPATDSVDGTDFILSEETLTFGDGGTAYVLGADSENSGELSASDVQALAGSQPLVVVGNVTATLRLEGGWSNRGDEVLGQMTYTRWVHGSGAATVLVLDGVQVEPELELVTVTPIGYWNFNETGGSTAADLAGTPQDGTYFGSGIDLDDAGPPASLAPFGAETATEFHRRSSEYVAISHDPEFEVANGTVQLWFNTDRTGDTQTLFSKDHGGYGTGGHLNIGLDGSRLEVRLQSDNQSYTITTDKLINKDEWYHVAFTFGDGGMKLYLNGVLVGQNSYIGGLTGNREPIVIGGSILTNSGDSGDLSRLKITQSFDGHIDEVAFFDIAFNENQIQQLILNGPPGVFQS